MKLGWFTIAFFLLTFPVWCQDMINPYAYTDWTEIRPVKLFDNGFSWYDGSVSSPSSAFYNGELQICLRNHPWGKDIGYKDFEKSYVFEVVSFPFDVPKAWESGGAADGLTLRELKMPAEDKATFVVDTYNNCKYWNYGTGQLYIKTTPAAIDTTVNQMSVKPQALISGAWVMSSVDKTRILLPHSVLKVTVRLHYANKIISSFSWICDMTRGRMNYYPFKNSNIDVGAQPIFYDLVFAPTLLHCDPHPYNQRTSILGTDGNGLGLSIDYTPYATTFNRNTCAWYPKVTYNFYENGAYTYPYAPPYSLVSNTYVRNGDGTTLAGYEANGSNIVIYPEEGIEHSYEIDRNIDLTLINPDERVIFNPSEVYITADNLVFPRCYTFKTIRGEYPTMMEAKKANTAANGGPYSALRFVPVPTDVSSTNDPCDASIYHIRGNLKIERYVKIFDATFIIEAGGTLTFDDQSTITGRYKITCKKGGKLITTTGITYNPCVDNTL